MTIDKPSHVLRFFLKCEPLEIVLVFSMRMPYNYLSLDGCRIKIDIDLSFQVKATADVKIPNPDPDSPPSSFSISLWF